MTHSPRDTQTRSASGPAQKGPHAAYVAGISPVVRGVILQMLLWLTTGEGGRAARTVKGPVAISALVMIMVCLPGSFDEKKALLRSIAAELGTQAERLRAKYVTWRQRKCWMWGGGFMASALTGAHGRLSRLACAARDCRSFAALIPD